MNLTGRFSNGMDPVRMRKQAIALQNAGRGGDTILAHINPQEARMLKRMGGAGTRNPITGLREYGFWDSVSDFFSGESDSSTNQGAEHEQDQDAPTLSESQIAQNAFDQISKAQQAGISDPVTGRATKDGQEINYDPKTNTVTDNSGMTVPANNFVSSGRDSGSDGSGNSGDTNINTTDNDSPESLTTDDEFKSKVYDEALDLPESYEGYLEDGKKFYGDDPTRLKDAKDDIDDMQTYGMSENPQTGEMEYDDVNKATGALNLGIGGTTVNKDGSITKTGATKDFDTASTTFDDLSDKEMGTGAIGKIWNYCNWNYCN